MYVVSLRRMVNFCIQPWEGLGEGSCQPRSVIYVNNIGTLPVIFFFTFIFVITYYNKHCHEDHSTQS